MIDTLNAFIKRCQLASNRFINNRLKHGGQWTEYESITRIYEEVAELAKAHRKREGNDRILEEGCDIILAVMAHFNRQGFAALTIEDALIKTLVKVEQRAANLK